MPTLSPRCRFRRVDPCTPGRSHRSPGPQRVSQTDFWQTHPPYLRMTAKRHSPGDPVLCLTAAGPFGATLDMISFLHRLATGNVDFFVENSLWFYLSLYHLPSCKSAIPGSNPGGASRPVTLPRDRRNDIMRSRKVPLVMRMSAGERFRKNLDRYIRSRGYSQRRFAALAGVNHANLSRILHGRQSPSIDTADLYAKTLGVDVLDLFQDVPERYTEHISARLA